MQNLKFIFFLVVICFGLQLNCDAQDTLKVDKSKNKKAIYREARKATIMSAVIPGLGQAYNRKW